MKISRTVVLLLSGSFFQLSAQNSEITGRVVDPSGAVIVDAAVTASNEGTGVTRTAPTNAEGYYTVPFLNSGSYSLSITKPGFKSSTRAGIKIEVQQVSRIDFRLEVGQATDKIEVTAEAPLVESETSSMGQVIHNKTINEMPLNGRNAWDLTKLSAATLLVQSGGDAGEIPNVSLAGSRRFSQALWLDGGSVQKSGLTNGKAELAPMIDAISEFKVITNNYAAEFGRSAGGVFTAVTKSGTNQFHGDAFEFLRNNGFDARNFFALKTAPLRYNQFGGAVGGPVRKNKTFFFAAMETTLVTQGVTTVLNVPSDAQRRGDFSALRNANGSPVVIYDPFSTRPSPTNPSLNIRDPFPGAIIPASKIDPVGAKAASYYGEPNQPGNAAGANNYNINLTNDRTQLHGTIRVDHELTSRDKIYSRFVEQHNNIPQAAAYPEPAASAIGAASRSINNVALTWLGSWTHMLSPSAINEVNVGGTYQHRDVGHASIGGNWPDKLGLTGVPETAFPAFLPAGYSAVGASTAPFRLQTNPYYQIIDTFTYFKSKHSIKLGFEYRHNVTTDRFLQQPSGSFTFSAAGSGLQGNAATGNGFATMLLGFATRASLDGTPGLSFYNHYFGGYAQDDWKISPTLTLNLGIRYDVETPRSSSKNTISSFNTTRLNPVAGVPGVVTFAGANGTPTGLYDISWTDISPRFGFAWRPIGGNTVVRGGFGVFYGNPNDQGFNNDAILGFGTNALFVSPDQDQTAAVILRKGFPPYQAPGPNARNDSFGVGGPADFFERNHPTPYSLQYNFGLQHEWKSILLEAQYIASLGRHLTSPVLNINQILPSLVGGPGIQSRRPFPQFTAVNLDSPNLGVSSYHALILRAEKRYANGFQFLVNYAFSKFIDNVNDINLNTETGYEDYYNRRLDKSLSSDDVPHNFSTNVIYELPLGPGKRWLKSGPASWILGGWQISTLGVVQSGRPYSIVTQTNTCQCFSAGAQRADLVGDPNLPSGQRSIFRWFNTAAFAQPALYHFGSAGRTVGRGPGPVTFDSGVMRNFAIRERIRLQFRGEFFNVLNHPNFDEPGTSLGGPNFGTITTALPARIIQLGMKLYF